MEEAVTHVQTTMDPAVYYSPHLGPTEIPGQTPSVSLEEMTSQALRAGPQSAQPTNDCEEDNQLAGFIEDHNVGDNEMF